MEVIPSDTVEECSSSDDVPILPQYEVLDEYTDRMELARVKERIKSRTFLVEQLRRKKKIIRRNNNRKAYKIEKFMESTTKFKPKPVKKSTNKSKQNQVEQNGKNVDSNVPEIESNIRNIDVPEHDAVEEFIPKSNLLTVQADVSNDNRVNSSFKVFVL